MNVRTPEETALSGRSVVTALTAVTSSAVVVFPGLVAPTYANVGAVALATFALAVAIRVGVATAIAPVRRDPPIRSDPDRPSVSVVVTAYNEADVLPETLDACLALDYPDDALEIVVCYEAASTDGTAAVAEAAAERHSRIAALERDAPPGGKAAATNYALSAAAGDVIGILDADQRPEPGALDRAVRWFADDDVWCVKGRCFGTNPGDALLTLCATVERAFVERAEFYARDVLGGFAFFTGGHAFFRAEALERLGPFDESILLEDVEMAYRLRRAGGEIRIDPGVVTAETNPASLDAWWSQRKRWARGGMQVARRYLGSNLRSGPPSLTARFDFAATLGGLVALPVLAVASPLAAVAWWHGAGAVPTNWMVGAAAVVAAVSIAAPYATFAVDTRDGRPHAAVEYLGPLLLWPYFVLLVAAVVAAFLEEFVFRRSAVYVTSRSADR